MNNVFLKNNLSLIQRITIAGLFIAIITILQKVVAINYVPLFPFMRISLGGPALIIFSSVLLGPWWGLLIGAASDIVGYFIFDASGQGFFPQITAIYALLGFVSYFAFVGVRFLKNKNLLRVIEYGFFAILFVVVTLFISVNNKITLYSNTYTIELWQKITIPCVLFVLFGLLVLCIELTNKYFEKKNDPKLYFNCQQISFACFVIELTVMVLFGTLMKGFAFGFQTYLVILIVQIIVSFINIPLNTFLISYIMLFTKRFYPDV